MLGEIWLLLIFLVIYLFPSYIAYVREHRNKAGVFLLNLFLGWTLLGWVIALVWAVYKEKDDKK